MAIALGSFWVTAEAAAPRTGGALRGSLFVENLKGDGGRDPFVLAHGGIQDTGELRRAMASFITSQVPLRADPEPAQRVDQAGLVLLERVGRAVLVMHPWGTVRISSPPMRAPIWSARSFRSNPSGRSSWDGRVIRCRGVSPPRLSPTTRRHPRRRGSWTRGPLRVARQAGPPRRLPSLVQVRALIVTAEASVFRTIDEVTVAVLKQAGAHAGHLRLREAGVNGNGHGLIFQRSRADVLDTTLARLGDSIEKEN